MWIIFFLDLVKKKVQYVQCNFFLDLVKNVDHFFLDLVKKKKMEYVQCRQ